MAELRFLAIQFKDSSPAMFATVTLDVANRVQAEYETGSPKIRFVDSSGSVFVINKDDIRSILNKDYRPEPGGGARQ